MNAAPSETAEPSEVDEINRVIADLLLDGRAHNVSDAEEIYLNTRLGNVLQLVNGRLSERAFRAHPLIALLMAHGSRGWEDSLS